MPVIYVDVLFFINFIIDGLLLICTAVAGGFGINYFRTIIAAVAGGLYSVFIFFPDLPDIVLTLSKLTASAVMLLIALKIRSKNDFIRGMICFYISNFILGGILTALMYFTSWGAKTNALLSNGSIYFNIRIAPLLIFSVIITVSVTHAVSGIKSQLRRSGHICAVTIGFAGKTVTSDGFIDTGNSLTAFGSGTPVTVAAYSLTEGLFDGALAEYIKNGDISSVYETCGSSGLFVLIPYNAVGTDCGFLIGFRPDMFLINGKPAAESIIAVYNGNPGKAKIIINPDALVLNERYDFK